MKRALLALLLGTYVGIAHAEQSQPLVLVKAISLDGVDGRIDHLYADPANDRLYVAALTNDSLEVIDLKLGKRVRSVRGPGGPQGITVLPDSHEVVVASGEDGVFRLFDATLNLVRFINELEDADNVRYDSTSKHVYLGYGKAIAAIDPKGPSKISEIALDSHPESFQVEKDGNSIYVNLPETHEVVVCDKNTNQVTARWELADVRDNFPMALDEKNHRLFIVSRNPAKLLVYDTNYGSYIGRVDCAGDADDVYYDAERKFIYITGGQGYITVVSEEDPYLFKMVATIPSAAGARTSCFDPTTGTLYVAVPHRRRQPAEIWVYRARP